MRLSVRLTEYFIKIHDNDFLLREAVGRYTDAFIREYYTEEEGAIRDVLTTAILEGMSIATALISIGKLDIRTATYGPEA